MRRALLILVVIAVAGGTGFWFATRGAPSERQSIEVPRPVERSNAVQLRDETVPVPRGADRVRTALKALMEPVRGGEPGAVPAGTRLLDVHVRDGLATVNLSSEFAAINDGGDTGESVAQRALRRALAQFPQVDRMCVLVDGKLFEGGHSGEWDNVPVRDSSGEAGVAP
jgi:germination protein M